MSERLPGIEAENERRERQVAALYELWRSVPHTETGSLLQRIAERAVAALDGHTCSLLLREKNGDTLRVRGSVGLPQDVADSVTLLVGERIAGRVAASGQPVLLNKDPRSHPLMASGEKKDITQREEVESSLCVPLTGADGAVHGVLCVSRFTPASPFTENDLRVLCLFAAQAGAAIAQHRIIEDLTLAAREAAQLERTLAENAHLATLGQMAATLAHELRNPLASIKGAAQFLLDDPRLSTQHLETLRDFLHIVIEEANGLSRLTTDLLAFARPSPPMRRVQDVAALVRQEVAFLRSELQTLGATISENYPPASAFAEVDEGQLRQVLRNLLLNAAQAGQARREIVQTVVHVSVVSIENAVIVRVEDNGPGIPSDVLPRLFEPFFTTKTKGSGLGLAQVHRIVNAHGGQVTCGNRDEGGAFFQISLLQAVESSL